MEAYSRDAMILANAIDCRIKDLERPQQCPQFLNADPTQRWCNWYIPTFTHPFFGGVMTILRIAAYLQDKGSIRQRFLICGSANRTQIAELIAKPFPHLREAEVIVLNSRRAIAEIPRADYSIATLWTTAYILLKVRNTAHKFYLIQDFEPLFYPAGSTYAQAELTYRFGFYGIANTQEIKRIYETQYGGMAHTLTPQIDPAVFYPPRQPPAQSPKRIFCYMRPDTPRNGFELAASAFRKLKKEHGSAIDIVCAGAQWNPEQYGLGSTLTNLGLLPYERTGDLYRSCHIGLTMMMTKHPSYLPLELMACGCLVVANDNPANAWLLKGGTNCLLAPPSISAIAETLGRAVVEYDNLLFLRENARLDVLARSSWATELAGVLAFLNHPLKSS
ncbi:MAG: glycosyltransferase family 4 protein [Rhizobiales bacterium]|nr:glycosyltransferase family 4 protein [Hyphomicrobiales bacterium]